MLPSTAMYVSLSGVRILAGSSGGGAITGDRPGLGLGKHPHVAGRGPLPGGLTDSKLPVTPPGTLRPHPNSSPPILLPRVLLCPHLSLPLPSDMSQMRLLFQAPKFYQSFKTTMTGSVQVSGGGATRLAGTSSPGEPPPVTSGGPDQGQRLLHLQMVTRFCSSSMAPTPLLRGWPREGVKGPRGGQISCWLRWLVALSGGLQGQTRRTHGQHRCRH